MLLTLVILYLLVTIAIGLWAAKRVKNTADFAIAGRHLPLIMIVTTTFATWFGAETVLGIPATFVQGGLHSIVEDPFGAGTCLILVGLFFAAKLYKMTLLTISDYYRERFGRTIEVVCSLIIILSYLGWVSAQVTALGLVFNLLSDGAISIPVGMIIGTASILAYTLFGGMWSVAVTDFMQMIILVIGLAIIAMFAADQAGGADKVIALATSKDLFQFWPEPTFTDTVAFFGAAITMMLGSIPQQDVFQRVMSAQRRPSGHARPGDRRRLLHPVRVRADVPRHQRADHHAGAGDDAAQGRSAEGAADAGARAHAVRHAGAVLRRAAVGAQVDRLGNAAGAVGDVRREHLAAVLPAAKATRQTC